MRPHRSINCRNVVPLSALLAVLMPGLALATERAPVQAATVGYRTNTFATNFTKSDIDLDDTGNVGFKWYLRRFFGGKPTSVNSLQINQEGRLALLGDNNSKGVNLLTAAPAKTPSKFVGTAFGGGAYFEAVFKFDPKRVVNSNSWPAFWSMSLEHVASLDSVQWKGEPPDYRHFIEADFFEYDTGGGNYYGGAIHDWYGIWNKTCKNYCQVFNSGTFKRQVPIDTDFTKDHKYGFLWVPATDTTDGYAEYYFDNQKVGARTSWSKFTDQAPPPSSSKSWTFGIMDQQHLFIVLGTGVDEPMTVRSVNVWQASAAKNLSVSSPVSTSALP